MSHDAPAYGLWSLVFINTVFFIFFATSFSVGGWKKNWRSLGPYSAFIVALFAEMYGFPLTIYLLSGWLAARYPGVDLYSHEAGHLWSTILGLKGDPHFSLLHILSLFAIGGGFILLAVSWRRLYDAQRIGVVATSGPYAHIRHPQYVGFVAIMFGFLLQWPTIPTVAMFPVMTFVYARLARHEEQDSLARFGDAYRDYMERVPAFIPSLKGATRTTAAAVLAVLVGVTLIPVATKFLTPQETAPAPGEKTATLPAAQAAPQRSEETNSAGIKEAELTANSERGGSTTTPTSAPGGFLKKNLPNGVELTIQSSGIEAKLLAFLDGDAKPTKKATWFDFDRLQFETGKATLHPSSGEQLQNIAHILAAYPSVKAVIGGYTDNVGNPGANKRLSQARAHTVRLELIRMGIHASRLEAKGYGDSHAIATNETAEGREKNRRISLGVTRK